MRTRNASHERTNEQSASTWTLSRDENDSSYLNVCVFARVVQVGAPLLVPLTHHVNAGDDNEDRKRLKEKLKVFCQALGDDIQLILRCSCTDFHVDRCATCVYPVS